MRNIQIEEALELALSLLERQTNNSYDNHLIEKNTQPFQYFYLFSNEDLSYLFEHVNVKNKAILTTGSSGDQVLYSILHGANNIVHFDLNPYCKYYFYLKCALIKTMPYKYFKRLFKDGSNPTALTPEIYSIISHALPKDIQQFWDSVYLDGFGSDPSTHLHFSFSNRIPYTKSEYLKLQENIIAKNFNVEFLNCDLKDLKNKLMPNEKFDLILLSNIYDYRKCWQETCENGNTRKFFKSLLLNLEKDHLSKDGTIQVHYTWGNAYSTHSLVASYLGLKNYTILSRPCSDEGYLLYSTKTHESVLE